NSFQKLTLLFFSISLVFLIAGCDTKSNASANLPKANPSVIVDVIIAEKEPVSNVIEANGTVLANEYVELRPEVSGRLIYLNLTEGSQVAKGTIIARVNDADLRAQL